MKYFKYTLKFVYVLLFNFLLVAPFVNYAQPIPNNYVFPINPGKPNYLAGTMGELRTGHFHGGIDIRTGGQIGLPVYATSDGYISRIAINTGGYGHSLYLQHDDGYISVYAHLEKFEPALQRYLIDKQYERKSYVIQDFPDKNKFRYKKGELIAYSGNTGSSTGPHLHFEIRDKGQNFLNPLDFGYKEIADQIPPIIKKVAFTTLDQHARVNGAFGRYEFEVILVNKKYTTRKPIELSGRVGIELFHYDHLNGTYSRNGIPEITLKIGGDTIFRELKNKMSFDENREILVHMDHATYYNTRERFNKLYLATGNRLSIYSHAYSYYFTDDEHEIEIILRDNFNNFSKLETVVNNRRIITEEIPKFKDFEIRDNMLHFKGMDTTAQVFYFSKSSSLAPYFVVKNQGFFLWDLRKGLPDSILIGKKTIDPNLYAQIPSDIKFDLINTDFELSSTRTSLFDTLYLRFEKQLDSLNKKEKFAFLNRDFPIRNNLTITLKPIFEYGDKAAVYSNNGTRMSYIGKERNSKGQFVIKVRDLNTYTIAYDTLPPAITPVSWLRTNLAFKIGDDLSGIKSYKASIDGNFILMRYETKNDLITAIPQYSNILPQGWFVLEVEDNLGNIKKIEKQL